MAVDTDKEVISNLIAALVECSVVLEALHWAGGTGLTDEIAAALRKTRPLLGIKVEEAEGTR